MANQLTSFSTTIFSVDVTHLAAHTNPVMCVLAGREGPVSVTKNHATITGDLLLVRAEVEHEVRCSTGGASVLYLDGLRWPGGDVLATKLDGSLATLAQNAIKKREGCAEELRLCLGHGVTNIPKAFSSIVDILANDPMERMTQQELKLRLNMERTTALRVFKASTGQTFRSFKRWAALQFAARQIAAGESVRNAAMDAGFADTAHLSRTFRTTFGLTPTDAIGALARAAQS